MTTDDFTELRENIQDIRFTLSSDVMPKLKLLRYHVSLLEQFLVKLENTDFPYPNKEQMQLNLRIIKANSHDASNYVRTFRTQIENLLSIDPFNKDEIYPSLQAAQDIVDISLPGNVSTISSRANLTIIGMKFLQRSEPNTAKTIAAIIKHAEEIRILAKVIREKLKRSIDTQAIYFFLFL